MKMIVADYFPLPNGLSLLVIVLVLAVTITASMIATKKRAVFENQK
jgi:hypothetical protein